MSGFEIITITLSFILGLGVAHILRSVAHVIREKDLTALHWIPISVAGMILIFQIQFWFALVIVNALIVEWSWAYYGVMLLAAILIFLAGATVLPQPGSASFSTLLDDFHRRGRVGLLFTALYLLTWIVLGIMVSAEAPIVAVLHLAAVNGGMSVMLVWAYQTNSDRVRSVLHILLMFGMIYGLMTVWTPPDFTNPFYAD